MKRGEKSGQGPAEKQENLGEKLKAVGKRRGHSTPVVSFWRLQLQEATHSDSSFSGQGRETPVHLPCVSARKLAATFWELHRYKLPPSRMHPASSVPPPRLRRLHAHQHHLHLYKEKEGVEPPDPSPSSPELPGSAGSLRRHVAASLIRHHRAIERSSRAIQPVSPASYGSSMEMAPYNPAATPTSSTDFKGRIGETSFSLKTSAELLKVLNRIWSLEEQHASNISLVKALKKELDHARARIKDLVRDQQADRHEIDELMKQITEEKMVRKSKEQDRINAAIQSARDELEDERKLRKRSESLHRKLARELYEVKSSLATALKDLDKERKSRKLLEELCDEFAWGIRDYERQLHSLRPKLEKDWAERSDQDRLILHISESWLDERMQMKLETQHGFGEGNLIVDKLSSEIETFLQTKQSGKSKSNGNLWDPYHTNRRGSLESIPLNVAVSAPQNEGEEYDSTDSDSHCFELKKPSDIDLKFREDEAEEIQIDKTVKPNNVPKKLASQERTKGCMPSNMPIKFNEQTAQGLFHGEDKNQDGDTDHGKSIERSPVEVSVSRKSELCEVTEEGSSERKNRAEGTIGLNSNYVIGNLIRSHYLLTEGADVPNESDCGLTASGNAVWRTHPSPIRQWTEKLPSHDLDISESSSKVPPDIRENTLKTKPLEARTRIQRSRLKGARIFQK